MKKGFTLIELLVVVLIIGILASVAVPEYEVAVKKATLAKYRGLVASMVQAQEAYFLANGEYAASLDQLDLSYPVGADCTHYNTTSDYYKCGDSVYGVYDGVSNMQAGDTTIRYLQFFQDYQAFYKKGERWCFASPTVPAAIKACKALGGTEVDTGNSLWKRFRLQ